MNLMIPPTPFKAAFQGINNPSPNRPVDPRVSLPQAPRFGTRLTPYTSNVVEAGPISRLFGGNTKTSAPVSTPSTNATPRLNILA